MQRASVDVRGMCGRKMEDGELRGQTEKIGLNGRNQGGVGSIAAVGFLQLPRKSVDVRGMFGRKPEAAELRGETEKNQPKWKNPGLGGGDIASVSFR